MDRHDEKAMKIVGGCCYDEPCGRLRERARWCDACSLAENVAYYLRDERDAALEDALRAAESADGAGVARGRDVACHKIRALKAGE